MLTARRGPPSMIVLGVAVCLVLVAVVMPWGCTLALYALVVAAVLLAADAAAGRDLDGGVGEALTHATYSLWLAAHVLGVVVRRVVRALVPD